jgi:hypothetical protein
MAMAGWDTSQMLDGLDGVMMFAAASGENLGLVSDIVTDALTLLLVWKRGKLLRVCRSFSKCKL